MQQTLEDSKMASSPQSKRVKLDHDRVDTASYDPPVSLKQFICTKLQQTLLEIIQQQPLTISGVVDANTAAIELTSIYWEDLLQSRPHWTNKTFSLAGNDLFKAIAKFGILHTAPSSSSPNSLLSTLVYKDHTLSSSNTLLTKYRDFIEINKTIFEDITTHHTDIQHKDWSSVTKDNDALEKYCSAASAMGQKVWVAEANRFMADYILKYFTQGGAVRHQQKTNPNYRRKEQSDLLQRDLMGTTDARQKIRVLDVGSCYNPIARMEGLQHYFDVTAMDLCPAHASVYKGDFLTLDVQQKEAIVLRGIGMTLKESTELELQGLVEQQFDAVTMSLVLSYLPTPEAREIMIDKARALLVTPSVTKQAHHKGLLVIAEKTSILATPTQKQVQAKKSSKTSSDQKPLPAISVDDWKTAICARGFETVTYQYLPTSDGRKSHLFVFAAVDDYDPTADKPRLYIKQDFYPSQSASVGVAGDGEEGDKES